MRKISKLILLLVLGVVQFAFSQGPITGTITTAEGGLGIPGATVLVVGTKIAATTDFNGQYSILAPAGAKELRISYVGMKTITVSINNQHVINVTMKAESTELDAVVVIGYGTAKKKDLTGAVGSVKGKDLEVLPNKRVDQALQGMIAGVTVQNTDGAPGGNATIRVRGSNSVLGGNNALVVIDGMQGGDLNSINPSDVQSVEVLKDASATAIFGSRGANGVILVTTKAGKIGKPTVSFSINSGTQQVTNEISLLNAGDYARTANAQRALNNGDGTTPTPIFTNQQIADFDKNGGTDWQNEIFRTAIIRDYSLSINGGTEDVKYFISGSHLDQEGVLINSGYKRYAFRSNVSANINPWLKAGLNISATKDEGKSPAFGGESGENLVLTGVISSVLQYPAVNPVYNADGSYRNIPSGWGPTDIWNPVASAKEVDPSAKAMKTNAKAFFNAKIIEGLTLDVSGFGNISNSRRSKFYNDKTSQGLPLAGKAGQAYISTGDYEYYQGTANLTYDKTIKDHHFTITAVSEESVENWYGTSIDASHFISAETGINDLNGASQIFNYSDANKRAIQSYLGRVNYSFMNKYLLTASYRADGSSVFGANNKWGYFPSASLAWKLSEEKIIKDLNVFSELKLRTSYGVTGNQAIQPYQTFASIGSGQNYPWDGGSNTNPGFGLNSSANPNLKWETTSQTNIGIDIASANHRISATVDVYKKLTDNLLLYRQLPGSSGYGNIIDNIGSIENKGLEITLGGDPFVGDFKWHSGFNITFNKNKVISLGDDDKISYITTSGGNALGELMTLFPGQPMGQMYGWGYEGTWKTSEAATAAKYGQLPGDQHYTDINNDFKIDVDDKMTIGNALPKYTWGWNNQMSYKNFDLNFNVQGSYGNDIFNVMRIRLEAQNGNSTRLLDRWTPDNQNTDIPAFTDALTYQNANLTSTINLPENDQNTTSRYVEDGSYIRLKIVSIGYNIPKQYVSKFGMNSLKAHISATNLFTLTKYTGYDPEANSYTSSDAMAGVDWGNYPQSMTISFGIDLSF